MVTESMDVKTVPVGQTDTYTIKGDAPSSIIERIHRVMGYYPELTDQDIVFFWKPNVGCYAGQYVPESRQVNIAPAGDQDYTIAHELTHAVQFIFRTLPYGERSCDLWTIARSHKLIDRNPPYLAVPKCMIDGDKPYLMHSLAKEAIRKRSEGMRHYIVWFESELRRQAGAV